MALLAFIIMIPVVVVVHELGHFLFARLNHVKVEAFSIGFGKKLYSWKDKLGTEWRICAIPLGGYVSMLGQSDTPQTVEEKKLAESKLTKEEKKQSFEFKKRYQKASIAFAGPFFNFIFGFVVFFSLFFFVGESVNPAFVNSVVKDSPAFVAGMKDGDKIIKIADMDINNVQDVANAMQKANGQSLLIKVIRDGKNVELSVIPKKDGDRFILGITYAPKFESYTKVGFIDSLKMAYNEVSNIVSQTVGAMVDIIVGDRSSKELGGIIAIAQISGAALESGFYTFMFLMAFISISLGLFNLFPIPILDGGYLLIYAIEGIIRRDLSDKFKEKLFFVGFMFIIFLLLLSNFNDIVRLLK